jgi:Domain of unknown function (DUF4372)
MVGDYDKPKEPSTEVGNMVGHASLFSQLLSLVDRHRFERFVREQKAERGAKGFSCWSQFVVMMFCQLAQAKSLREIIDGLACCEGKLRHLGLERSPKRSTLSYANTHRPWQLYENRFIAGESTVNTMRSLLSAKTTAPPLFASAQSWCSRSDDELALRAQRRSAFPHLQKANYSHRITANLDSGKAVPGEVSRHVLRNRAEDSSGEKVFD